jgi:hypothetical protein
MSQLNKHKACDVVGSCTLCTWPAFSPTKLVISIRRLKIAGLLSDLSCTFNTVTCHELDCAKEKARHVVTNHELFTC